MTDNLPAINLGLLPAAQEFQMFQTIAKSAKASGLYGGDENKIFMVMLAARELGIPPMLALNGGIWNIQGKIEISARLMNSMIRRAGHTMKITSTATECIIQGKRADSGEEHTETFTMQMAITAGLANGNVWKKYPEDMLYNRCMSRLARRLFPDVIGTAYVEGEIKEAKEVEKQELQQAQFEDVTPPNIDLVPEHTELVDRPVISAVQAHEIELILIQLSPEVRSNVCKAYEVSQISMLPVEHYEEALRRLNASLRLKKQNEAAQ